MLCLSLCPGTPDFVAVFYKKYFSSYCVYIHKTYIILAQPKYRSLRTRKHILIALWHHFLNFPDIKEQESSTVFAWSTRIDKHDRISEHALCVDGPWTHSWLYSTFINIIDVTSVILEESHPSCKFAIQRSECKFVALFINAADAQPYQLHASFFGFISTACVGETKLLSADSVRAAKGSFSGHRWLKRN